MAHPLAALLALIVAVLLGPPATGAPPSGAPAPGGPVPTSSVADTAGAPLSPVASPVAITARISPDPSNIGDLLDYEIVAAFPRGVSVNLPSVLSLEPMHLVSSEETEPEVTGEGLRKTFTIRLQHFEVGEAQIPGFSLTYVDESGQVQTVPVPPKSFTVEALLANEADPVRKLEDAPISLDYPNELAEVVIYSALATLAGAAILIPLLMRLFGRQKPIVVPPPIPPHQVAYEALEELEGGDLLASDRFGDYYVQLTEIAKGYLEGRFGVEALDRTTDEIRSALVRHADRVAPLSADEIVRFLQECDLVKFARLKPDPDEATDALSQVRTMVDRTVPAAAQPQAPEQESESEQEPEPEPEPEPAPAEEGDP